MATKFYLTTNSAAYTPTTLRGAWDDTGGAVTRALQRGVRLGGGTSTTVVRGETSASNTFDVLMYRGVSTPLDAQTISGTVDLCMGTFENNAAADFYWHVHIYVTQGDTDTPRGTLLSDYVENTTNEFQTTALGRALQSAQSLSSLAISSGDRIVVEIGYIARNSSTTTRTATLWYGTLSSTTGGDHGDLTAGSANVTHLAPFVEFSGDIAEASVTARETQLPVEVISYPDATIRVTQLPVEVASYPLATARLSQLPVEVVTATGVSAQRVTQLAVEIVSNSILPTRSSQMTVETALRPHRNLHSSQFVVEDAYRPTYTTRSTQLIVEAATQHKSMRSTQHIVEYIHLAVAAGTERAWTWIGSIDAQEFDG